MKIFINRYRPIQYINKTPYLIHAIAPIEQITNLDAMKKYLGCESAFKTGKTGVYYFCNEIKEPEYEDI